MPPDKVGLLFCELEPGDLIKPMLRPQSLQQLTAADADIFIAADAGGGAITVNHLS